MSRNTFAPEGQSTAGYGYGSADSTAWHGYAILAVDPTALSELLTRFKAGTLPVPAELPVGGRLPHFDSWLKPTQSGPAQFRSDALKDFLRAVIGQGIEVLVFRSWGTGYDHCFDGLDAMAMAEIRMLGDLHTDIFYDIMGGPNDTPDIDRLKVCPRPS